jgi:RHS repeat-associated protein
LGNSRVACRCVEKPTATTTTDAAYLPVESLTEHYEPWGASIAADILPVPLPTLPNALPSINTPQNRFTYNGKELQTDIGLFEYGFRWYDSMNARFTSIDPLANDYAYKTPYDYAENEPIAGVDLDGAERKDSKKEESIFAKFSDYI